MENFFTSEYCGWIPVMVDKHGEKAYLTRYGESKKDPNRIIPYWTHDTTNLCLSVYDNAVRACKMVRTLTNGRIEPVPVLMEICGERSFEYSVNDIGGGITATTFKIGGHKQ